MADRSVCATGTPLRNVSRKVRTVSRGMARRTNSAMAHPASVARRRAARGAALVRPGVNEPDLVEEVAGEGPAAVAAHRGLHHVLQLLHAVLVHADLADALDPVHHVLEYGPGAHQAHEGQHWHAEDDTRRPHDGADVAPDELTRERDHAAVLEEAKHSQQARDQIAHQRQRRAGSPPEQTEEGGKDLRVRSTRGDRA